MTSAAPPAVVLLKERDAGATTARAGDAVGPTTGNDVLDAVYSIAKEYDGFLEL